MANDPTPMDIRSDVRPESPGLAPGEERVSAAGLRSLLGAMQALCDGDFSVRANSAEEGTLGEMAGAF
ncbi:hypothetical protein AB4Z54_55135, partial [Streptomyces sp. MCAF7]